jgi:hypothetical protein
MVQAILDPLPCLVYIVGLGVPVVPCQGGFGEQAKDESAQSNERAEQMMKLSQAAIPRISRARSY